MEQHWRRAFQKDLDLAASHRKLAEAYATLKDTQAQLVKVEKTAALGRLVANVAHRINTPIGNVVAVASHLDDSLRRFSDTMVKGGIRRSDLTTFVGGIAEGNGIVLSNAQQTADLIELFKRLVADGGEPPERMDVVTLLIGIRPSLEAMMPSGVALAVDASPGLQIMGQWHVMEAVVGELVRNAVTHAFSDGCTGTVTIRARAASDGATGGVEFQVIDDGQGIPPEHLEHVFDPFYTDGNIGGGQYGLGLSIVHNAVVGHLGGWIDIDSREGQGTSVTIRLPAV
ncbi:sensor histidine kinase [Azospirillum sp. sgz301742]